MPSIFDPRVEAATRGRVARLAPDSPARWGRMSAARWLPVRLLFVYLLPWPKGKLPTTREFQQPALSRFVARGQFGV